jgi:hypothetical protein
VTWNRDVKKWRAQISIGGKIVGLGYYMGEDEAAREYDRAALRRSGLSTMTNFPASDYTNEPPQDGATTLGGEPLTSKFNGVYWNLKAKKWRAQIRIGNKKVYLGLYMEEDAARVRDLAKLRFRGLGVDLNFPLCEYTNAAGEVVYPPHVIPWMVKVDEAMGGQ